MDRNECEAFNESEDVQVVTESNVDLFCRYPRKNSSGISMKSHLNRTSSSWWRTGGVTV